MTLLEIASLVPTDSANSGGLYETMLDYPLREGKALRPAMCLATAGMLGVSERHMLPTAAIFELFHNAFLIHDDVEDGSDLRRGAPTLHEIYGKSIAINVGDGMYALALPALLKNLESLSVAKGLKIIKLISKMMQETAEGQMLELSWIREHKNNFNQKLYSRIAYKKTVWYSFLAPIKSACIAAGKDEIRQLDNFATHLGLAFQIQDDVLNLTADSAVYGKEHAGDLWEGKPSLMLLHAYNEASAKEQLLVKRILEKPRLSDVCNASRTEAEVEFLLDLIVTQGSIDFAWNVAQRHALRAQRLIQHFQIQHDIQGEHADFLLHLGSYVVERER
jgi:geranylgeranyl diphosphate synthase type II